MAERTRTRDFIRPSGHCMRDCRAVPRSFLSRLEAGAIAGAASGADPAKILFLRPCK